MIDGRGVDILKSNRLCIELPGVPIHAVCHRLGNPGSRLTSGTEFDVVETDWKSVSDGCDDVALTILQRVAVVLRVVLLSGNHKHPDFVVDDD